jgi:beta-mannosidase
VACWTADRVSGSRDRYLSVNSNQDCFPSNRHFFAAIKDLRRDPVEPDVDITASGDHELMGRLEAPSYAYFVHLEVSHEATHFSDNYFDLSPGEERNISVTNKKKVLTPENIEVGWR